ncbi:MATE family efflux transporter [Motilimonas cestriensis]|uniref:MATE family efflux transporter n=1 Tax=Motilimonas cestriensis TaxID=2742685 RepID=A0ABS8W5X9_9GAMM|nr:MATE family efflux transporter [Motilimonas cestriensis]MCE2593618.1 MATE family efflux transporter [Motilimonas cestriensis]
MKAKIATATNQVFLRKLWQLALPVSLQSLLFSLLGLVDILMVGQLGEAEVAAVGLGNRVFFFNLLIIFGLSGGVSVLAAQYFGKGEVSGVRRCLVLAVICAIAISLPFALLYTFAPTSVITLASDTPSLVHLGSTYLQITGATILLTAIVVPIEASLRAVGDAKTPTNIGILAIVLNVFLNWVLIFGHLGFPELGVEGSAWGTTISRLFQTLILILYVLKKRRMVVFTWIDIRQALRVKEAKRFSLIAIPLLIHDGFWAFGVLIYSFIFARIGVDELAVMSMLASVEGSIFALFIGFAVACSTMLGHELGANKYEDAWQQSWVFIIFSPVIALFMTLVILLFKDQIASIFSGFEGDTLDSAIRVLIIMALALSLKVLNMVGIMGVLRSGGDVNYSIFIDLFCMWCIGIPLTFVAATVWGWPLYLVYLCSLSEELVKAVLMIFRVHRKKWLKNLVADS